MKSIAMICAHLAGRNTGMATVDLAGWNFLRRTFPDAAIAAYTIEHAGQTAYSHDELPIVHLPLKDRQADAFASDVIIYWGDFLHAPGHWKYDIIPRLMRQGIAATADEAENLIYRLHMLEGTPPDIRRKAVIFGGTVITNGLAEQVDRRYSAAFRHLIEDARGVFFRDPISAANASRFRDGKQSFGADCALLLEDEDVSALPGATDAARPAPGRVGVCFGRSRITVAMLAFARLAIAKAGLHAEWFPWIGSRWRSAVQANAFAFSPAAEPGGPADTLAVLRGYDAIITDTYHLCVNAWRMGIPAICIGRGAEHSDSTISSKKKEIFYSMHGASDYYVFQEDLRSPAGIWREANQAAELLRSPAHSAVTEAIRAQAATAKALLLECLR